MYYLQALFSAVTLYLLYGMGAVPFAVWAGRAAYTSTVARSAPPRAGWPSRAATVFSVLLPALFIASYWLSGIGEVRQDEFSMAQEPVSEWGPILFLLLPPSVGLIIGFGFGVLLGRDRGRRG